MTEPQRRKMTVEEFFEGQLSQDRNYELVDGVPVLTVRAKTGASARHDTVIVNAIVNLGARLRSKPCKPRTSDQSVLTFRGARRPDDRSMATAEPRVVIEILSPSTTRYDRFQKLEEHKLNASIKVILLVDTEAPRAAVWKRGADGWGYAESTGLNAVIDLPEIEAELPLSELTL